MSAAPHLLVCALAVGTCGCASDGNARYWVNLSFDYGEDGFPAGDTNVLHVSVCADPTGRDCGFVDLDPVGIHARDGYETYEVESAGESTRITLAARESSRVGGVVFLRVWVAPKSSCCPAVCSPGFSDLRGDLADSTLTNSPSVSVVVPMVECPEYVTCTEGAGSACGCDCSLESVIAAAVDAP